MNCHSVRSAARRVLPDVVQTFDLCYESFFVSSISSSPVTCIQCADFQSSCKLQNHILLIFFSCHMNEPILTILNSIQAVKCKTKIGLRAGMGNGGYTERVLGPIIWQSSLEIVHEPGCMTSFAQLVRFVGMC